jgi:hypothetical protein
LRPEWTGDIVAKLHIYDINQGELAKRMLCSRTHLSRVLNGRWEANEFFKMRCVKALDELIAERSEGSASDKV